MSDLRERIAEIIVEDCEAYADDALRAVDRIMALLDTADSERLDWLEAQDCCEVTRMGTTTAYWIIGTCNGDGTAPTLRAAIDAARQADHDD